MKFITGNLNKLKQAQIAAEKYGFTIEQESLELLEIQEKSSRKVVYEKAVSALKSISGPFILEDSSFHLVAWNGFPGAYVKYVYSSLGCEGFLKIMEGFENRDCYFESHIAYVDRKGFIRQYAFKKDGLYLLEEIHDLVEGCSGLWKIIGIKNENLHFSKLNFEKKIIYNREWEKNNSFVNCFAALNRASLL